MVIGNQVTVILLEASAALFIQAYTRYHRQQSTEAGQFENAVPKQRLLSQERCVIKVILPTSKY
jgi:hypothetical protein